MICLGLTQLTGDDKGFKPLVQARITFNCVTSKNNADIKTGAYVDAPYATIVS